MCLFLLLPSFIFSFLSFFLSYLQWVVMRLKKISITWFNMVNIWILKEPIKCLFLWTHFFCHFLCTFSFCCHWAYLITILKIFLFKKKIRREKRQWRWSDWFSFLSIHSIATITSIIIVRGYEINETFHQMPFVHIITIIIVIIISICESWW